MKKIHSLHLSQGEFEMIVLPKENEHKKVSLEKQLEELNDMKNVLLSSKSTINLDYSLNIIN